MGISREQKHSPGSTFTTVVRNGQREGQWLLQSRRVILLECVCNTTVLPITAIFSQLLLAQIFERLMSQVSRLRCLSKNSHSFSFLREERNSVMLNARNRDQHLPPGPAMQQHVSWQYQRFTVTRGL